MGYTKFVNKFGAWAIVTGASSGIGTGFAQALAARGLNLVLVSRREDRLNALAQELSAKHHIETRVVATDLSSPDFLADIRRVTDSLDVGLLISNAGAGAMGAMLRVDVEELLQTLSLNTAAHLRLTHHFGDRLVQRQSGGILLVGSMAGNQGTPFGANYAGAKAYIHNLGQALNYELRDTGVNVSVTVPGPTSTPGLNERTDIDMTKLPGPVMSVETLVSISLKGLAKNKALIIPGAPNRVMDFVFRRVLPRSFGRNMLGNTIGKHTPARLTMTKQPAQITTAALSR